MTGPCEESSSVEAYEPSLPQERKSLRRILKENRRYILSFAASVILTVVVIVLPKLLPIEYEALGNYGYLGVFLSTMLPSATVIFPSPTLVAAYVAGTFLNPLLVGLVAGLGATIGEITGYLAGYGGSALAAQSPHYERIRAWIMRFGLLPTIFVLAVIPNPLFDLTGIAAGAMGLPLWQFLLVCFFGKTIRFVLIAYIPDLSERLHGWFLGSVG